jgi:hypothetical protein
MVLPALLQLESTRVNISTFINDPQSKKKTPTPFTLIGQGEVDIGDL